MMVKNSINSKKKELVTDVRYLSVCITKQQYDMAKEMNSKNDEEKIYEKFNNNE